MEPVKRTISFLVLLAASFCIFFSTMPIFPQENTCFGEVYFSPNGGCTDAIVRELDKAQSTVVVQAYSFASYRIGKALPDAHKRWG